MTIPKEFASQILVRDIVGNVHIADVSDMMNNAVNQESVRRALEIYFHKHNLLPLSAVESVRHGFPKRTLHLDRKENLLSFRARR